MKADAELGPRVVAWLQKSRTELNAMRDAMFSVLDGSCDIKVWRRYSELSRQIMAVYTVKPLANPTQSTDAGVAYSCL